jgi:hypothetical protein
MVTKSTNDIECRRNVGCAVGSWGDRAEPLKMSKHSRGMVIRDGLGAEGWYDPEKIDGWQLLAILVETS